jgi:hypothetical protein
LGRDAVPVGDGFEIALDNALLRFVLATDGRGEGLGGLDVTVANGAREAVIARARERRCRVDGATLTIGGVRISVR